MMNEKYMNLFAGKSNDVVMKIRLNFNKKTGCFSSLLAFGIS